MNPAQSKYDELVRDAEAVAAGAARSGIVDARVIRLFDCYGAFMEATDGRLIPELIGAILAKVPISLGSYGSHTRALTYVGDAVALLRTVVEWPLAEIAPIEIGAQREASVEEIARTLARIARIPFEAVDRPRLATGSVRRRADASRARFYDLIPATSLADGLGVTYRWFAKERPTYA
jgi:UDP-glucuronate decarboxylase